MKVLIACEYSGVVRDAFRARGHDAWSCDLLPTEVPGPHIQEDVRTVLARDWDLVIAHPPCTDLSSSGARWWAEKGDARRDAAVKFARQFEECAPRWAIENPVGRLSTLWRRPDQIVQPWQFSHPETKATCLWLGGLPPLTPTAIVEGRTARVWRLPPSPDRWKARSTTYTGIAAAMAEQWG